MTTEEVKAAKPEASNSSKNSVSKRRRWISACILTPIAIGACLVGLVGLYYGTGYVLTSQANAGYESKDCYKVVNSSQPLKTVYNLQTAPFIEPALAQGEECQMYVDAAEAHEAGDIPAAVAGYRNYTNTYPDGIMEKEVSEGTAQVLLDWSEKLYDEQNYSGVIQNLTTIGKDYKDTKAAENTNELRARTYLAWGKQLRAQKDFDNAKSKLNLVSYFDPDPKASQSLSSQAKQELAEIELEWGDDLAAKDQYELAIQHYNKYVSLADTAGQKVGLERQGEAFLNWASQLADSGDFTGALDKINRVKQNARDETLKAKISKAEETTLVAFSQSTGEQAQAAIKDFAKGFCNKPGPTDSLLIGLDEDTFRVYVDGHSASISNKVLAQTPASLHYVGCVKQEKRTIQTCPYNGGYYIKRQRYYWIVTLYDVLTGDVKSTKEISGGSPDSCAFTERFTIGVYTKYKNGSYPSSADLESWLSKYVK
jgi:tetratricopeptide (TPR) repeat protein